MLSMSLCEICEGLVVRKYDSCSREKKCRGKRGPKRGTRQTHLFRGVWGIHKEHHRQETGHREKELRHAQIHDVFTQAHGGVVKHLTQHVGIEVVPGCVT